MSNTPSPRSVIRRRVLPFAAMPLGALALLAGASPAQARTPSAAAVALRSVPAVVAPGSTAVVSVRVSAKHLTGRTRSFRVQLVELASRPTTVATKQLRGRVRRRAMIRSTGLAFVATTSGSHRYVVRATGLGRAAVSKPFSLVVKAPTPATPAPAAPALPSAPTPSTPTATTAAPVTPPAAVPAPAPTTSVLEPSRITEVPEPGEPGDLRVTGNQPARVGDTVASGVGEGTPYGFLGRVTAVRTEGDDTVLTTVPTSLPDALPSGDISQVVDLGEVDSPRDELDPDADRRGARLTPPSTDPSSTSTRGPAGPAVPSLRLTRKVGYECGAEGVVTVKAVVDIRPKAEVTAHWDPFHGVSARFVGKVIGSSELSAAADGQASCKLGPVTLFKRTLPTIQFAVGPVPVVIVPVLTVTMDASGKVEASVRTEASGSITASAGIQYADGEASPVAGLERDFGYTPPDPTAKATLSVTAHPKLDLRLYGAGGPTATFDVGVQGIVDPSAEHRWKVQLPVELKAKLDVPDLKIESKELSVYKHTFLLAQEEAQDDGDGGGDDGAPVDGAGGSVSGLPLRFDELPEDADVTDQYQAQGVIFDSDVFTTSDESAPNSPVLSGSPKFDGPISGHFVKPGTTTPTTVNRIQLDAGYINAPGSVEITATTDTGRTITAVADEEGTDAIYIAAPGIVSFTAQAVADEPAGFAIDNLDFG